MRMSQLVAPTLREDPSDAEVVSHKLLLRGGFIRKLSAGIYNYLPLGWRLLSNVTNIVREELNRAGAQEVLLPALIPAELWGESGRWNLYGKELFRIKDRHDREFCLGPTHEEVITDLVRNAIRSYKQLPVNLYQIQTKFRDEIRPRFGLMRGREFLMKDAYSFHATEESLDQEYQKMYETYCRIFDRLGLKYRVVEADSGLIGGGYSQEFLLLAESGEEEILACNACDFAIGWKSFSKEADQCPKCNQEKLFKARGIEVGHIFKLGTKYSSAMKCSYLDEHNQEQVMIMGCYGIGVSRIVAAAIEQNNDKDGIVWPLPLAPFKVAVVPANVADPEQAKAAEQLYGELRSAGIEVLFDDRDERLGVKLKDIDLIGIPYKVIIGKALKEGKVEAKERRSGETTLLAVAAASAWLAEVK